MEYIFIVQKNKQALILTESEYRLRKPEFLYVCLIEADNEERALDEGWKKYFGYDLPCSKK